MPLVDADEVEDAVWRTVDMLRHLDNIEDQVAMARRAAKAHKADGPARARQQLIQERDRAQAMVNDLFDMLHAGDITRDQFREQNRRYTEKLEDIERKLADVPAGAAEREPAVVLAAIRQAASATTEAERRRVLVEAGARVDVTAQGVYLSVLDLHINLRGRLVGDTWHFGDEYQRLDFRGKLYTDKQIRFIQRTYGWANKGKLAERLGRSYGTLRMAVKHMRDAGVIVPSPQVKVRK
jgi:hypothetical protein